MRRARVWNAATGGLGGTLLYLACSTASAQAADREYKVSVRGYYQVVTVRYQQPSADPSCPGQGREHLVRASYGFKPRKGSERYRLSDGQTRFAKGFAVAAITVTAGGSVRKSPGPLPECEVPEEGSCSNTVRTRVRVVVRGGKIRVITRRPKNLLGTGCPAEMPPFSANTTPREFSYRKLRRLRSGKSLLFKLDGGDRRAPSPGSPDSLTAVLRLELRLTRVR